MTGGAGGRARAASSHGGISVRQRARRLVGALLLLAALPGALAAQRTRQEVRQPLPLARLRAALGLDSAQTAATRALLDTFRMTTTEQRALLDSATRARRAGRLRGAPADSIAADSAAARAAADDLRQRGEVFEEQFRALLRPDQRARYDSLRAVRPPGMRRAGHRSS
jgi:hypothetical protein